MSKPTSAMSVRGARLEAIIRKALADAWARKATLSEADSLAVQVARETFPDMPESEISAVIRAMRRESDSST